MNRKSEILGVEIKKRNLGNREEEENLGRRGQELKSMYAEKSKSVMS